jgi:hypothetical protein
MSNVICPYCDSVVSETPWEIYDVESSDAQIAFCDDCGQYFHVSFERVLDSYTCQMTDEEQEKLQESAKQKEAERLAELQIPRIKTREYTCQMTDEEQEKLQESAKQKEAERLAELQIPRIKTREYTCDEWVEKGKKLFGDDRNKWTFVCPACGNVQTIKDFDNIGCVSELAWCHCIGRHDGINMNTVMGQGKPCNYTANGLFYIGHTIVITVDADGTTHNVGVFDYYGDDHEYETPEEVQARLALHRK